MPAVWPGTLPTVPLWEGYREAVRPTVIETAMDVGPGKARPRTSKYIHDHVVPYKLTTTQRSAWLVFYWTTLRGGADVFDWPHPTLHVTVSARLRANEPIELGMKIAPNAWRIVIPVESYPPLPV